MWYNDKKKLNKNAPDYHKQLRRLRQKQDERLANIFKAIIVILFCLMGCADFICKK